MAVTIQSFLDYHKEFQKLHFQLQKQYGFLHKIEDHISCICTLIELLGSNVKDLASIKSVLVEGTD